MAMFQKDGGGFCGQLKIKICLKEFTNGFDLNLIPKTLPDFVGTPLKGRWCRKKHLVFFDKCGVETKASLPFKGGAPQGRRV